MSNLEYDSTPLFEVIPSFFRDSYEQRPVLEALYRGWLRTIDNDYANLFTINDNKDLTTLRPTTLQPLVYRKIDKWTSTGANHSHRKYTIDWPSHVSGKFYLFIPSVILDNNFQLFLDKDAIPSYVYNISTVDKVTNGAFVSGTQIIVDRTLLNKYLIGEFIGDAIGGYIPDPLYDSGHPEDAYSTATIYSSGYNETIEVVGDGSLTTIGIPENISAYETDIVISRVDVTPASYIEASNVVLDKVYPAGSKFFVRVRRNSGILTNIFSLTTATNLINLGSSDSSSILEHVQYVINYKLGTLSVSQGVIRSEDFFKPQTEVRVHTRSGIKTQLISTPVKDIKIAGVTENDILSVIYCGAEIFNYKVVTEAESVIKFNRALNPGTVLQLRARIVEPHTHKSVTARVVSQTDEITLVTGDSDVFPEMIFLNGDLLLETTDYSISDSVVTFTSDLMVDDELELYLVVAGSKPHAHKTTRIVPSVAEYVINIGQEHSQISPIVFNNGRLVSKDTYRVVDNTIIFNSPVEVKNPYILHTVIDVHPFECTIPEVVELAYNYKAQITSCELIQNGVEIPSIVLDPSQFDLLRNGRNLIVRSSVPITNMYLVNCQIDENSLQDTWGSLIGYYGDSTPDYARKLSAILLGLRSGATPWAIENIGSILLGSDYSTKESNVVDSDFNTVTFAPTDGSDVQVTSKIEDAPLNDTSGTVRRLTAVNSLVQVEDGELLYPWIALFAEELSDTFRASRRLDEFTRQSVTGSPSSYIGKVLIDYNTDFDARGVYRGDLVKGVFGSQTGSDFIDNSEPVTRYARVTDVIDKHSIRVDFQISEEGTSSYGENGYGEGLYGGASPTFLKLSSYTVSCRNRHRLDTGKRLDVRNLNELVADLLPVFSAHSFLVRLSWVALKQGASTDGLSLFLNKVKPAESRFYVFTEAFSGTTVSPLRDALIPALMQEDPIRTKPVNVYATEYAFLGLGSVPDPDTELINVFASIGLDNTDLFLDFEV